MWGSLRRKLLSLRAKKLLSLAPPTNVKVNDIITAVRELLNRVSVMLVCSVDFMQQMKTALLRFCRRRISSMFNCRSTGVCLEVHSRLSARELDFRDERTWRKKTSSFALIILLFYLIFDKKV